MHGCVMHQKSTGQLTSCPNVCEWKSPCRCLQSFSQYFSNITRSNNLLARYCIKALPFPILDSTDGPTGPPRSLQRFCGAVALSCFFFQKLRSVKPCRASQQKLFWNHTDKQCGRGPCCGSMTFDQSPQANSCRRYNLTSQHEAPTCGTIISQCTRCDMKCVQNMVAM